MRKPGLPKLTNQSMEDAPEDTKYIESIKLTVNSTVQEVEAIRSTAQGIKLLGNADVEQVEVDVQMPDPWIVVGVTVGAPGYDNGWADDNGTRFYKAPDGVVEIRMSVKGGAAAASAITLPVGYRPANILFAPTWDSSIPGASLIVINTNGTVVPQGDRSSFVMRFLSLDATPIAAACWPKLVKTKFAKVSAVLVADVFDAETSAPLPAGAIYHPAWETASQGGIPQVKLLNIAGLPYNRKSRVRLLIIGG